MAKSTRSPRASSRKGSGRKASSPGSTGKVRRTAVRRPRSRRSPSRRGSGSLAARLRGHPLVLALLALLLVGGGIGLGLGLGQGAGSPSPTLPPTPPPRLAGGALPPPAYAEADLERLQAVVRAAQRDAEHADDYTDQASSPPDGVRLSDPPAASREAVVAAVEPPLTPKAPAAPISPPALAVPTPAELAALPGQAGLPAWLRHAVPPPAIRDRPMVAVVIDDMGVDRRRSAQVAALPGPLTLSYLTYAPDGATQARAARARGHELMVHVPMEAVTSRVDPGPGALRVGQSPAEVTANLEAGLARYQGYVGINNHMGSRFTEHAPGMRAVMAVLKARGLLWLDSRTSPRSVGGALARQAGLPHADRAVFLDHEEDLAYVQGQLARLEAAARQGGAAIAIGHPKDNTIAALARWLPTLEAKGLVLVPVSTIVRAAGHAG